MSFVIDCNVKWSLPASFVFQVCTEVDLARFALCWCNAFICILTLYSCQSLHTCIQAKYYLCCELTLCNKFTYLFSMPMIAAWAHSFMCCLLWFQIETRFIGSLYKPALRSASLVYHFLSILEWLHEGETGGQLAFAPSWVQYLSLNLNNPIFRARGVGAYCRCFTPLSHVRSSLNHHLA